MLIFTTICTNYLPKAMVLADSIKQANPSIMFLVCLLERDIPPEARNYPNFDAVVLAKDIGFSNFEHVMFKHSIVEASTAVKGQAFKYLFTAYPAEKKFVYLDPDILVISDLIELHETLNTHNIILTPHLTIPESKPTKWATRDAVIDNELCTLQHGVYNLGFLAIKRSFEAENFINWWASRLDMFCYNDISGGIFTDQRWIDLVPCFFDVFILKHPGYNVAPWNLSMRKITCSPHKEYFSNGEPLRFFHFSGFDSGATEAMINKYVPDKQNPVWTLKEKYVTMLKEHGQDTLGQEPWSYDYFLSGEKIDRQTRILFRNDLQREKFENPFLESNKTIQGIKKTSLLTKCNNKKTNQQKQASQEQEQIFQQQNRQIYSQARIIRQQKQRIQAIENTLSWKITEPLRKTDRFLSIRALPLSKSILLMVKNLIKGNTTLNLSGEKSSLFHAKKEIKAPQIEIIDLSASEKIPVEETMISVIIPVLNGAKYLKLLLPALKGQKGIRNIEIIIVDSGSTDNSLEICKNFETQIIQITPDEFSHSHARNIGAENAHGQYLLFLTQDALPTTDNWLYEMLNVLKKNDVAAVSCKEYPRSDADLFTRVQMWRHYNWLGMTNEDKILSKPASSDYHSLRKHSQLDDVACLMKETVFSKYRFQGEYAEDIDLGLRLIQDGDKVASVSSVGIIHSHTRSCYYYLQRGYIDSFSMSKLFTDFPPPESDIAFNDFCDDIILTYFNLSNAVDCLKDLHKMDITTFFENFLYTYNDSKNFTQIKQHVNFYENSYVDKEFKRFLSFILQYATLDKIPVTRNVHSCLLFFICDTKKYMLNIYESFNNNLLKDFSASMYKSLALHIGMIFSNNYTRKPGNLEMSKLYDEFFDRNVQKVRI